MLREKIFKNKRTRVGRALPAVIAAVIAVCGLGSCAALEMLDSMAAEEESAAQYVPQSAETETPAPQAPPIENADNTAAETSAAEDPAEQIISAAESLGEASGIVTPPENNTNNTNTDQSAGVNVELNTDPPQPVQQPSDGSLLTALTEGGGTPDTTVPDPGTPGEFLTEAGTENISGANMQNQSQLSAPAEPLTGSPVYRAYTELVNNYASLAAVDPAYKPEYCRYYITDIDDDGTPELLIEMGTIETDRTINVFTFNGVNVEGLGNFVAWHTTLGDGNGVLYTETSAMGSYMLSTIRIQDGKLFTEREEQPFSETQIKMPLIGYGLNDRSALEGLR